MLSEGKLEELEKVCRSATIGASDSWVPPPTVLALISELRALRAERDKATAEAAANWQEYLDERSARMAANNREHASETRVQAAEAELAALRAQAPAPVEEATRREHTLAQIPALIMANIEEVPDWQCSALLVTAHCHASVLHEDLPDALISPAPVGGEVVEADIPAIIERGGRGEALTASEQAAWSGYELGWRDGRAQALVPACGDVVKALRPFADIPVPSHAKLHWPINYMPVRATYADVVGARKALANLSPDPTEGGTDE